ncbi:hypothetical protein [Streptomyces sp. FZ201]|uniref:hypothetical protein n=1 Tax=Streptomyces sp. FZ201 TaxID=3057122 RepID=UPI0021C07ADD|nr:hypothetical protein [Streptomyces sp. FZ201]
MSGDYDALLEILDFSRGRGGPSWRWRISSGDGAGAPGEFPVDPAAGASADSQSGTYGFLTDPHGFIRRTRLDEVGEANQLRRLGQWLRTSVLTQEVWDRLPLNRPSTVLIRLNPDGPEREVLRYPLLLAADEQGITLAARELTFVHDVEAGHPAQDGRARRAGAGLPLHLVGVFNRTKAGEPLDLHAEQLQVFAKVRHIAADGGGLDITTRTLSYHVTHDQLKEQVQSAKRSDNRRDAGRWQMILHLADRGAPGAWSSASETGDATAKPPLTADELVGMLATGDNDQRLRLTVITTRPASSPSIADQLEMFRIPSHRTPESPTTTPAPTGDGLAVELARHLGCPVLAFRHRIGDQAAVTFLTKVYENLLAQGWTLPRAVGAALRECLTPKTLDLAAPVLYGADACGLVVEPPPLLRPDPPTMGHRPSSLIGHHDPMWRASEIFARLTGGEANGAVLHGMTGVGKEACARELISQYGAHRYRHVVWYPLKGRPAEPTPWGALRGFVALLLEQSAIRQAFEIRGEPVPAQEQLDDFLADDTAFERFCNDVEERLTNSDTEYFLVFLRDVGHLIARSPRDARTTDTDGHGPQSPGPWLDPRWARLIDAMTQSPAPGFRLLITSPLPLHLDQRRLPDIQVPLLAPAEAFLHAQSLPHLGRIITTAARDMAGEEQRRLVHNVLARADGHPGLLRFADGVAAEPDGTRRLQHLATVDGDQLGQDHTEPIPEDWRLIEEWTAEALNCVPRTDARQLLLFALSLLSPRHRVLHPDDVFAPGLLAEVWAGLRIRCKSFAGPSPHPGRGTDKVASTRGEEDELRFLLESLAGLCLIDLPANGTHMRIRMHPAVAEAVRRVQAAWLDLDGSLRAEVDRIAIRHTAGRVKTALRHRTHGRTADAHRLIPEAMPYLERASDWETWLHFVAVRMTRSRRGRDGLGDTLRKLERVTVDIRDKNSDQFKMAQRLSSVFKAIDENRRPGLSALLGKGPGDPVVDNSPLAMAMSAGILSGLRDTGRLTDAREVAEDYLRFCDADGTTPLVADAVEVELLRVMVDRGELPDALHRMETAFETLADVRFRDAVHHRWAGGEILRRKLFTIRRDTHVLLADAAPKGSADRARHLELARADHERLGQYLDLVGPDPIEGHLHAVEGCLLGLDPRLENGNWHVLEECDGELVGCLSAVEHSGDVIVQAMTDVARARIKRQQATQLTEANGRLAGHGAMKTARDYELKALRLLYAQGTPMDIGACHRRIGDDQLACEHESLLRSTHAHHMYATLVGRLTGAHILAERDSDRARWQRSRSERGVLPATVDELCGRVQEDLSGRGGAPVPGALDPRGLLRKLAADSEVERGFGDLRGDS